MSNPTDTLQALNESKLGAKIQNTTQSAKNKLKKFNNGDFSIRYNGTFAQVRQDLRKLLALSLQGRSDYAVYDTPNGRLAFRLTDHNANGNNFEQDEADINLSVYVAFEEFDHVECSIRYKEYRIASDVFEANRETCINAIINGVYNALEGKEFEIDNSIAQMTEYNKPITCKEPSDDENNQEKLNCNRNMNKNRIKLTESQLRQIVKESVDSILKEGSKKKDPMSQWFNDFNKASKNREIMDYVNKGGRNPLSKKKEDNEVSESYNKLNGLHRLAYENQGMKEKIKEVAQFADIVAGVAHSEGRDNYAKFYKPLASNIFQMLNLWGFLDNIDD